MTGEPSVPFRVSHILVDIDGTIADYTEATGRAALDAAATRCSALTGEDITPRQLWLARQAIERDPTWSASPTTLLRREAVRRVLIVYGADSDEQISEVMAAYEEARDLAMLLFPDAIPALSGLQALGIPLVAASNGDFDLGRLGIAVYFAGRHFAVDAGVAKPDPRFFSGALARFGIEPSAALFVGDRLDNDYTPARAAGMHAVLIERPSPSSSAVKDPAVLRIASLLELAGMVERA